MWLKLKLKPNKALDRNLSLSYTRRYLPFAITQFYIGNRVTVCATETAENIVDDINLQ